MQFFIRDSITPFLYALFFVICLHVKKKYAIFAADYHKVIIMK